MTTKPDTVRQRGVPFKYCSFDPGMQVGIVELLNSCFGDNWCSVESWEWKHSSRPGFEETDVGVFVTDECGSRAPIACFHMGVVPFQLAPGLKVMTSVEGDFAVAPEFRGQGFPDAAHINFGNILLERGVTLRIGFAIREKYERLYRKRFGHISVPLTSVEYCRRLDSSRFAARIANVRGRIATFLLTLRRLVGG